MKFRTTGRAFLAALVSLTIGLAITACGSGYTIAFVYSISQQKNEIDVFKVDSNSGALSKLIIPTYPSGGQLPVAGVVTPGGKTLYVVHQTDNTVVQFTIGPDGKLYPQNTYNTPGTFPTNAAMDPAGKFLFVVDRFAPGVTAAQASPPGALIIYPIGTDGSLGAPTTTNTGISPVAVNALANSTYAYVVDQGSCLVNPNGTVLPPCVDAFTYSASGATAIASSSSGTGPNAIASDPGGRFVYVTDGSTNQLIGYVAQSNGSLTAMLNGPFTTDRNPRGLVVDPRGMFIYVVNYGASDISSYTIDQGTGNPTAVASSNAGTDTGPTCVAIEPATGRYLYTANFLGNTLTGDILDPHTGVLKPLQNSPYPVTAQPICVAAVANGSHATQHIQP